MSWVKVDDQFPRHRKVQAAGAELGRHGVGRVMAVWLEGQCHAAGQLTDGFIPRAIVRAMVSDDKPFEVAKMLVKYVLWHDTPGGYQVHDYHDWNPAANEVKHKRKIRAEAGRIGGLKSGAVRASKAEAIIEADSKQTLKPGGSPVVHTMYEAQSNPVPVPVPVVPTDPPGGVSSGSAREKPLGYRPRIDVAWPGRPPVPGGLHAEFRSKLGGDPDAANAELRAWYPVVAAAYEGEPIGDDDWRFWRARFREWVGTTVAPADGREAAATTRKTGPSYTQTDWFEECKSLHNLACNGSMRHYLKMQIDAAKGAAQP
jgi:hypothetical protein